MSNSTASRLYPPAPLVAASIAVFRNGHVLLAKRTRGPGLGRFALPGGLVELGETIGDAALRELTEETGVVAKMVGFNCHHEIIERDRSEKVQLHYIIASFVGTWLAGEGETGPEAGEIIWAKRPDLAGLDVSVGLAPILERAFDLAGEWA